MGVEVEIGTNSNLTNIQNFFYGQSVFITGVTGVLGKVILEKLLRSCTGIGIVYVHMRQKKGLTPERRLEKLLNLELFKEVKKMCPSFANKVKVIEGDISKSRLGISFEDYEEVRQNVSIVIHSAASVNFNDSLKKAADHNLKGTQQLLDMCHDMPNIKAVVHVSTSYAKREPDGSVLEKIPKTKITLKQMMDALEWIDEDSQKAVSNFLTENSPLTTYSITKAFAEVYIDHSRGDLPVAIVRPSYIGPTYKEPFPGWIDSIQGVSGLFLAGGKGVFRALLAVRDMKLDMIPVDLVTNVIITSAWHVGVTRPAPLFIINTVFDMEKIPSADKVIVPRVISKREEYPLLNMFRYPSVTIYYNKYLYKLHALFDEVIPALIVDLLLFIFTGRTILFRVYTKIFFLTELFYKICKNPWKCRRDNLNFLKNIQSERDAEIFCFETENFDWLTYIDTCCLGGRKFLAHENQSNVPYAKKKAFVWWTVTTTLKWCIIFYFLYYLLSSVSFPIYERIEEKMYNAHLLNQK